MELIRKSIIPSSNQEWLDIRGTKITGTQTRIAMEWFCSCQQLKDEARDCEKEEYKPSKFGFIFEKLLSKEEKEEYLKLDKQVNSYKYEAFEFGKEKEQQLGEVGFNMLKTKFPELYENATLKPNNDEFFYLENHYIGATPDFIIEQENGDKTILECKTCSYKSYNDFLVKKYSFQVMSQMICSGIQKAFIIFGLKDFNNKNIIKYEIQEIGFYENVVPYFIKACDDCYEWFLKCKKERDEAIKQGYTDEAIYELLKIKPTTKQDELILKAIKNIKTFKVFQLMNSEKKEKTKNKLSW